MGRHTSVLTYTMGIVEDKEKGKEKKNKEEEIMAENFQNVIKGTNLYIREVQQTPGRINAKILTLIIFMILKFLEAKDKEIISKVARDLLLDKYEAFEKINRKLLIRNYGGKKSGMTFFLVAPHGMQELP